MCVCVRVCVCVCVVQILDLSVRILHSANTLRKGMHPTILPLAMSK